VKKRIKLYRRYSALGPINRKRGVRVRAMLNRVYMVAATDISQTNDIQNAYRHDTVMPIKKLPPGSMKVTADVGAAQSRRKGPH